VFAAIAAAMLATGIACIIGAAAATAAMLRFLALLGD
jgi:hypothetical protein